MQPSTLDALYGGSLLDRLQLAIDLWSDHGAQFLSRPALQDHLNTCHVLQDNVRLCMEESGMPAFCHCCARSSESGGCCSLAMTEENDAVLLLLNLLAGSPVKLQRSGGTECLFLGKTGCSLRFKPFFCLNYLCRQLRENTNPTELIKLEQATGRLLQQQYATEQYILGILKDVLKTGYGKGRK